MYESPTLEKFFTPPPFRLRSAGAATPRQRTLRTPEGSEKLRFQRRKEAIQAYIAGVKGYAGVSGDITFAANHDVIKNIGLNVVKGGKFVATGSYKFDGGKLTKAE